MGRLTFSAQGKRIKVKANLGREGVPRPPEEVVRQLKNEDRPAAGQDYRERALAIYGLICGRCGREFTESNRHLLTIHHRDGNHNYNPPDGSNWEPLCVYCHDDIHSREILGDYLAGSAKETVKVYEEEKKATQGGFGTLGERLSRALKEKKSS